MDTGDSYPEYEADLSLLFNADLKKAWSYTSTHPTSSWHGTFLSTGTILPSPQTFRPFLSYTCAVHCKADRGPVHETPF